MNRVADREIVTSIAEQAKMGPATTIIDGLAVGMFSTGLSTLTIVLGIIAAFADLEAAAAGQGRAQVIMGSISEALVWCTNRWHRPLRRPDSATLCCTSWVIS